MTDNTDDIDWSLTTWEGSRRAQLMRWASMSMVERFAALGRMRDTNEFIQRALAAHRNAAIGRNQGAADIE